MRADSGVSISNIRKEEIVTLNFPNEEVLKSKDDINQRKMLLEKGVILGNVFKGKSKLIFEDNYMFLQIETHLWGVTDDRVILKHGIVIPINRIHEVRL